MAVLPADLAWPSRWRALRPNAVYYPTFGLETAWRTNFDQWKYPLEDTEAEVLWNGQTVKGRTFSGVGLVIWDPAHGPVVVGWP